MIPKSMIDLLLSHSVYVIFLGDPFQLMQIDKNDSHDLLDNPHIFLDEVMRQAAESEIIQVTMKIRNGEELSLYNGKEVMILPKAELSEAHMTWADQIIVATNNTRYGINNFMRSLNGFDGLPKDGDKMICTRNYWDDISGDGNALVNGSTGIIRNPFSTFRMIPKAIRGIENREIQIVQGDFISSDGDTFEKVEMDRHMIEYGKPGLDWKTQYILGKNKAKFGDMIPREFEFGYAITCHKSQGSEWNKVLVIEEKFPFSKEEHARWLYTACTRSAQKLVLIRP